MVTTSGADATETLPAASVSVAVRLCGPSASALVVTDQLPPCRRWRNPPGAAVKQGHGIPAVAVPVITGVVTLVRSSPMVPVSLAEARVSAIGGGTGSISRA